MDDNEGKQKEGVANFIWEIIKFTILALLIVVPIRVYIAQPYIVSGGSMEPTFGSGEYLIVDQLSYRFSEPERGDVIIFRFPQDTSKFFIKRIIALPGETLTMQAGIITITNAQNPEGFEHDEPYLARKYNDTFTTTLEDNEYFVMGDNRGASLDSRIWGVLPEDFIVGKTFLRLFPITEVAYLPGHYNPDDIE